MTLSVKKWNRREEDKHSCGIESSFLLRVGGLDGNEIITPLAAISFRVHAELKLHLSYIMYSRGRTIPDIIP